jgi:hypothetical protein
VVIVEVEVPIQCGSECGPVREVAGIDEFVPEGAPEAFDEYVVEASSAAIQADAHFLLHAEPR